MSFAAISFAPEQSVWGEWSLPPWTAAGLLLTAVIYVRGWLTLQRLLPANFPTWRLFCFLAGLLTIFLAVASPIAAFDDVLLTMHMIQHLFFLVIAPPLLLLGAPAQPLLRGLPRVLLHKIIGPVMRQSWLRRLGHGATHPVFCWLAMCIAMLGWHVPGPFEAALRSKRWHEVEHISFLLTSLLFWWPVLHPWPSRPRWSPWLMVLYLLSADVVNTMLSAVLAFSDRVLYPSYLSVSRPFSISALQDQVAAGAIMWVLGSLVFLAAAAVITLRELAPRTSNVAAESGL